MKHEYKLMLAAGICFVMMGCSIPNLEPVQCTESRDAVKEFYSIHFGSDMRPSENYFNLRKRFLTESLGAGIAKELTQPKDYFTQTDDYAKAFRIGGCKVLSDDKTNVEILLFWRSDARSEQRAIHAETIKENGKWLINKVEN